MNWLILETMTMILNCVKLHKTASNTSMFLWKMTII